MGEDPGLPGAAAPAHAMALTVNCVHLSLSRVLVWLRSLLVPPSRRPSPPDSRPARGFICTRLLSQTSPRRWPECSYWALGQKQPLKSCEAREPAGGRGEAIVQAVTVGGSLTYSKEKDESNTYRMPSGSEREQHKKNKNKNKPQLLTW